MDTSQKMPKVLNCQVKTSSTIDQCLLEDLDFFDFSDFFDFRSSLCNLSFFNFRSRESFLDLPCSFFFLLFATFSLLSLLLLECLCLSFLALCAFFRMIRSSSESTDSLLLLSSHSSSQAASTLAALWLSLGSECLVGVPTTTGRATSRSDCDWLFSSSRFLLARSISTRRSSCDGGCWTTQLDSVGRVSGGGDTSTPEPSLSLISPSSLSAFES